MNALGAILAMAVGMYAQRITGFLLADTAVPPAWERALTFVPIATLTALVVTSLAGRTDEARKTYERILALRNDVGLLSEEYDVSARRLIGNLPQAYSHIGVVNTANNLAGALGPAYHRARGRSEKITAR